MIRVDKLSKVFGNHRAVDQISFEVSPGEVLGFLGPNGAGKSTTMKMLTCFLAPTSGNAEICGESILKNSVKVRQHIGYLPESAPSYTEMLVEEFLGFIGEMRGFQGKELQKKIDHVLELTALTEVRSQMIETLSKGYRQRTCLAQAVLHEPSVLILDEPTDGLDPNQKHEVRELIRRMSENATVLISTHILEEVEAICSRALIIAEGRQVGYGTPQELLAQSKYHNAVTVTLKNSESETDLKSALSQVAGVESLTLLEEHNKEQSSFQIFPQQGKSIMPEHTQFIHEQHLSVQELYVDRGRLDDVFRQLTRPSLFLN